MSFLLLVFLIMFVTTASASAKIVHGPRDYKVGSQAGVQYGYKEGYHAGYEDCLKHSHMGVLTKIPSPAIKDNWTNNYKRGYKEGFKKGYVAGYNSERFTCLKKQYVPHPAGIRN